MYKCPPFTITVNILSLTKEIGEVLGKLSGAKLTPVPLALRRSNKIKTIQASLAIEGNPLTVEQVTCLLNGKRVIGSKQAILEMKNALNVYEHLSKHNALSSKQMLQAHRTLMQGLAVDNGKWRQKNVGVFRGKKVVHMAPSAKRVPDLMANLFQFLNQETQTPWLIRACVFHYEVEFIHPFSDGNGRIGRLWQQLLLMKEDPTFEHISVESLIKANQQAYYAALEACDKAGESTLFIEFMLRQVLKVLQDYMASARSQVRSQQDRLEYMQSKVKQGWFTRKEYMAALKNVSTATASRDLLNGVKGAVLVKRGSQNRTVYKFL